MRNYFTLMATLLLGSTIFSQQTESLFLHFQHNAFQLEEGHKASIDQLITQLKAAKEFEIKIIGHTDQDGSKEYNLQLAQKRAQAVDHFIKQKDLPEELVELAWEGEFQLLSEATSAEAKRLNRRVELRYTIYEYEDIAQFCALASRNAQPQIFKISNQSEILELRQGASLFVPKHAFEFEDGSVPDGDISLEVLEAYSFNDMLSHDLSTDSKGQLIETAGMLHITAQAEGRNLKLKEEKSLELISSIQELKEDMQVFNVDSSEEQMTWLPTEMWTQTTQLKNDPIPIDLNRIINFDLGEVIKPQLSFEPLPAQPKLMKKPFPPSNQVYVGKKYEEVYKKYESKLAEYNQQIPLYEQAIINWNAEVDRRIHVIDSYRKALTEFEYLVRIKRIQKKLDKMQARRAPAELLEGIFSFLSQPQRIKIDERKAYKKAFQKYTRDIIEDRKLDINYDGHLVYPRSDFCTNLRKLVMHARAKAQEQLFEQKQSINRAEFGSYVANIKTLGWINIDRFKSFPQKEDLYVLSPSVETRYYMIFKNIRSMIRPSWSSGKCYYKNIPTNEPVKLVAVKLVDEKPLMAVEDIVIGTDKSVQFEFHPTSLRSVREELNSIDPLHKMDSAVAIQESAP